MPKTLTPLSAMQCDVASVQAFQRLVGWTWVLTGLAFAIAQLAVAAVFLALGCVAVRRFRNTSAAPERVPVQDGSRLRARRS